MNASQPTPRIHQSTVHEALVDVHFLKITGPTGDWIVIHGPTRFSELATEEVVWLCNRSLGVGGVGVVLMRPTAEEHPAFHLEAWMDDGTPITHLTEAARAATYALAVLDKIPQADTSHHVFSTSFGLITTVYTPVYVGVDIGQWSFDAPETATTAASDTLVMAAGLMDPRPGLSIRAESLHITVAVESKEELDGIDLSQSPSIEPQNTESTGVNFVVPQDPLISDGMGQLVLRHHSPVFGTGNLSTAAATATVAFQIWAGLTQLRLWNVSTPQGDIVVQLHDGQRISTFANLSRAFSGRL